MQRIAIFCTLFMSPLVGHLWAQKTYTAASCDQSAVQAAITAELASPADGDIIAIPACGSTAWTGSISATFTTSVTIQGAGAISATAGGAGTTGSDATTILDHNTTNGHSLLTIIVPAGKSLRFTGIAVITDGTTAATNNGVISLGGQSSAVRIDHCHFYANLGLSTVSFNGGLTGVADHNYFATLTGVLSTQFMLKNGMQWKGDTNGGLGDKGEGDGSWADTDHWGTNQFVFIEDNRFTDGDPIDGNAGAARFVFRHNTLVSNGDGNQIFWHGLEDGRGRGTRAGEIYQNTFSSAAGTGQPAASINSGTLLFWGNTVTNMGISVQIDYTRSTTHYPYGAPPSGWGECNPGNSDDPDAVGVGTYQVWDNASSGACLDAPGRGAGDLLRGYPVGSTVNTATGTQSWPHQALSPIYVWNNSNNRHPNVYSVNSGFAANREYYLSDGASCSGGTCTSGIGSGSLSARPANCTAGPGGNNPGVGYWATDTNTLYVCTGTNTWTAYYTPYTYPHPLTSGTDTTQLAPPPPTSPTAPMPPTTVTATVH